MPDDLIVTRRIKAPPARLWKAWSSAEGIARWFGPRVSKVVRAEADLRIGGQYRIVIEAPDGMEALDRFKGQQGKIDLVLTDLVMPHMSGHELWRELSQLDPQLSFLFMSGYTEDSAMRRDILSRQAAFLNKPFSVADLSNAIQRALGLRSPQPKQPVGTA